MPRLSNSVYLNHRLFLCKAWLQFSDLYKVVSLRRQWAIFEFYAPRMRMTDDQAIAQRLKVSRANRQLASRAGKGFQQMAQIYEEAHRQYLAAGEDQKVFASIVKSHWHPSSFTVYVDPASGRRLTVAGQRKQHPDYKKLSEAITAHVVKTRPPS